MKYFTKLFVFLAWYLEKISDINATKITQKEQIQKMKLNETWRYDLIERATAIIALKRNILLFTSTNVYIIHSENTTRILKIEGIKILIPFSIVETPDGAFDVPSVTVTSQGKIYQLNVSDPMKPTIASDLATDVNYYYHVWINKNEFLAANYDGLSLFEIKNKGEAKEWNKNTVSMGQYHDLVLFQKAPNSIVVYSRSTKQIQLIWPEDAAGKPGDWRNGEHIRQKYIECDTRFLTTADLNNDGKTDLLVAFQLDKESDDEENVSPELEKEIDGETKCYFEVRAYEIPEEFKNPDKYTKHVLISSNNSRSSECIKHLKAFTPFTSYKGKPWILVSHSECGEASYLQPESEEVGNWNYKMIQFHFNGSKVLEIEVADCNQDGYTELYILADRLHVYSFSNGKITVTDPLSTPSSSSIFYLDSTLLMFIWLFL